MLDFNHIMNTPGVDIQRFYGDVSTTLVQWKTWIKPRGAKMVYMIAVGGAASGGCSVNTAVTGGGGPGGGSGAQSTLLIPAMFLPDTLYIQAGRGGQQPATLVSGALGVAGTITYVGVEPNTTLAAALTVLFASPGTATTAATTTAGGTGGTAAVIATIANMPLAGRGAYQFFAGQIGTAGGTSAPTSGVAQTYPTTGLMVMGGTGGGGASNGGIGPGGAITRIGFGDNYPSIPGGALSPPIFGSGGIILKPFQHTGGTGGGALGGAGGNGAPGCGGGGAGASSTANTTLGRPGDGGPGFVIIMSW